LQYYPESEKFYFTHCDGLDNDNQYQIYTGRSNPFSSSFSIQRKWIFGVKIDSTEIKYTIYPYRYIEKFLLQNKDNFYFSSSKKWYDTTKDNVVTCSVEHFTFTNLTLEYILDFIFENAVEKQIEHVLRITQIYHLQIHEKNFTIPLLIQTVNLG